MNNDKNFNVEDLCVARIMEVINFNSNKTELSFVKYAIFQKTDDPTKYIHCLSGEVYETLDASTLRVGQVGIFYQTMKSFYEQFQKSFEQNPDLKNRPLFLENIEELETKLTNNYLNSLTLNNFEDTKKD